MSSEKWYKDGLRFKCTQCGNCCTGPEGYVWVNDEEIAQIAAFINAPVGVMKLEHTRPVGSRVSLKEFSNGDCTFFDPQGRGCTIYPVRPRQCRTWPFWNSNLESPEAWQEVQQVCPGAGNGNFFSLEEIEAQAAVIRI
jgi:Fe-S-cluster containining protein